MSWDWTGWRRSFEPVVIAGLDPAIHLFSSASEDGSPGLGAEPVIGPATSSRTRWRRPGDDTRNCHTPRLRAETPYGKDRHAFTALAVRRPARLSAVARKPIRPLP
jgi:hypothetical protein